jgi:hypothetical protein
MSLSQEEIRRRIEIILDQIADAIIQNPSIDSEVINKNQRTIRDGIFTIGRTNADRLVLYSSDIEANPNDLLGLSTDGKTLEQIVMDIPDINQVTIDANDLNNISLSYPLGTGEVTTHYITDLLSETITNEDGTTTIRNPQNVGQFISFIASQTDVDVSQAQEYLDTNIFELLPDSSIRQEQIDDLFSQIDELLPPPITDEEWGLDDNGRVNRLNETSDWEGSQDYYLNNSISSAQNNEEGSVEEEDGFITRLEKNTSDVNSLQSIESLRNRLNTYLKDVDEQEVELQDERTEYENQSEGYLKFRNLNQGIIIRNTNQDFVEGLNPNTQEYLQTGFTITMWVRFLDKTSSGTLFNFGNPLRTDNPFGFQLETYVINGDNIPVNSSGEFVTGFSSPGGSTWGQMFRDGNELNLSWDNSSPEEGFFSQTDTERFVRLVVRDESNMLRGSHVGMSFMNRRAGLPEFPELSGGYDYYTDGNGSIPYDHAYGLMTNTRIPTDFNEWYFICATYNPFIQEDESFSDESIYDQFKNNREFWMNHINPIGGAPIVNSTYGNKCKVEIISRSDLLRARGFKG